MCGIVGYVGRRRAAPILLKGLYRLEYRGYDSAGIALVGKKGFEVYKREGKVSALEGARKLGGRTGIGHTRWATHGKPSAENAHPHLFGRFAVVHNGIIENYAALREECLARGEKFASETDSETIAHLLEHYYRGDAAEALRETVKRLEGSYAIAVACSDAPDLLLAARQRSPLVVGKGKDGLYLASDIPALAGETEELFVLADGELAVLKGKDLRFYAGNGSEIEKKPVSYDLKGDVPELCGYSHYMRKEIDEIPAAIANSLFDLKSGSRFSALCEVLCQTKYVHIIACGTAYHSGIAAKYAIETLARIPVEVRVASEYRYADPIVREGTLAIAVSQSGETADTLAAAKLASERGAPVVAVTNAPFSSLTRLADHVLLTGAGREIGVAATKSYNAQLAALYSLAVALAGERGADFSLLRPLPTLSEETLSSVDLVKRYVPDLVRAKSAFFIGRGCDYCAALEGSLKLKEISYLPSEGYPAGELKHGTLALVEEGTPVIVILTQRALAEKTMNAVSEVRARGGRIVCITSLPEYAVGDALLIPKCEEVFSPILSVIPLQALAYYTALARGNDPDKPRNLAKSVTVE